MNKQLLETALYHSALGRPIIAVTREKRPYQNGWNNYFDRQQTESEVRDQFSNGAYGAAMVLWPASPYAVLDFDGPHARAAWAQTRIQLPNTARFRTASGGEHLYFVMPKEAPSTKRKVRLVTANCTCIDTATGKPKRCGVDLLIHGYAIIPPTPGYSEDQDHPLEDAVEIPAEIIELAGYSTDTHIAKPYGDGSINQGERNATLTSIAGSMRRRGMSHESILAALREENARKCNPPLDQWEVESIARSISKYEPAESFENLTDLGNARRLVKRFGADLRFCSQRGWLTWTGNRWEEDETGAVERMAKATVRSIYSEAGSCEDKELRDKIATHAYKSEADARIRAMIAQAKTELEIVIKNAELDNDPWLLNVMNGTLDLRTNELRQHCREDLITKLVPVEFYPEATCPTWLSFLERVTAGNQGLIRFIRKAVGYCLTGSTREQVFFILYGVGANGKSTFVRVISALLSDYSMQTRTETLMAKRGDQIPNDIARLAGARFVSAIEAEGGRRLAESLVKQMTGGDHMTARFLHREFFEFEPTFKLWLAVNHKPRIVGTDHAIWRRIRLIPFDVTIPDAERDPDLSEKLKAELPGILAWAVEGCVMWQLHGLKAPDAITEATKQYREESDPLATFITDRCTVQADVQVGKTELYNAFREWTQDNGERELSQRNFNQRIAERGFEEGRNRKNRFWKGLALADL